MLLNNVTVSNNDQNHYGKDLILIADAYVVLSYNTLADNYFKYKSVIKLQCSLTYFTDNIFTKNKARYIIKAQGGSSLFIQNYATVAIVHNVAYKVLLHENLVDDSGILKCPLQVYDTEQYNGIDDLDSINCTFVVLNNAEMISKYLPTYDQLHSYIKGSCIWYSDRTISEKLMQVLFIVKFYSSYNTEFISKCSKRFVPLSVCPCSQNDSYSCYNAKFGISISWPDIAHKANYTTLVVYILPNNHS